LQDSSEKKKGRKERKMYKSTLAALALLGVASAANSTASLWLVGFEQESIVGSVIASVCVSKLHRDLTC
jgi:hypothetical protein